MSCDKYPIIAAIFARIYCCARKRHSAIMDGMSLAETYYSWVKDLPIVDWHNHLDMAALAADRPLGSLYEVWVKADPDKHRAMRICGEPERLITGDAPEPRSGRRGNGHCRSWLATRSSTGRRRNWRWWKFLTQRSREAEKQSGSVGLIMSRSPTGRPRRYCDRSTPRRFAPAWGLRL